MFGRKRWKTSVEEFASTRQLGRGLWLWGRVHVTRVAGPPGSGAREASLELQDGKKC